MYRFELPDIGEGLTDAEIVHWHVSVGDDVTIDQLVVEVETAKTAVEITSTHAGTVLALGGAAGDTINVLGPIGRPFAPAPERPNCLLIGGGVGIPPMVFLADSLRDNQRWKTLAIFGSEIPFPFELQPSTLATPWFDDDINSAMPLLESWDIPSRLTSGSEFDGCFRGFVTDLALQWLESLDDGERAKTQLFACGPTPMLQAVAALAERYELPCQVSLEEFMACAVGGCAGCTVLVQTDDGPAMKKVCVEGPVFEAAAVFANSGA